MAKREGSGEGSLTLDESSNSCDVFGVARMMLKVGTAGKGMGLPSAALASITSVDI